MLYIAYSGFIQALKCISISPKALIAAASCSISLYLASRTALYCTSMTTPDTFKKLIAAITGRIAGQVLDGQLEQELNTSFPAAGPDVRAVLEACLP